MLKLLTGPPSRPLELKVTASTVAPIAKAETGEGMSWARQALANVFLAQGGPSLVNSFSMTSRYSLVHTGCRVPMVPIHNP